MCLFENARGFSIKYSLKKALHLCIPPPPPNWAIYSLYHKAFEVTTCAGWQNMRQVFEQIKQNIFYT